MDKITSSRDEVISVYKETYSTGSVLEHFGYKRNYARGRTKIIKILKEEQIYETECERRKIILPRDEVISLYKESYSVTEVLKYFGYSHGSSDRRNQITNILRDEGIFEGLSGPNFLKKRQEKIEKTNLEKYGVKNYSYTKHGSLNLHNHREKSSFPLIESFREYQVKVNKETKKTLRKMKNKPKPTHCEYVGIEFIDDNIANPNDQLKRTVDHKKSVYNCWLEGISVKKASSPDNLAWVCRYINSIKGNADYEDIKHTFPKIKDKLCQFNN